MTEKRSWVKQTYKPIHSIRFGPPDPKGVAWAGFDKELEGLI